MYVCVCGCEVVVVCVFVVYYDVEYVMVVVCYFQCFVIVVCGKIGYLLFFV